MATPQVTTATVAKDSHNDISQDWHIDLADALWPVFWLGLTIMAYRIIMTLIKRGMLKGFRLKNGNQEMSLDVAQAPAAEAPLPLPDPHEDLVHLDMSQEGIPHIPTQGEIDVILDELIDRKYQTTQDIRAAQKKAIEEYWEIFSDRFPESSDYRDMMLLWRDFSDPLVQAADDNHVLTKVSNGLIDILYLSEKVQFFNRRYDRFKNKTKAKVPTVEELNVQPIMEACLLDFVAIATKHWNHYKQDVAGMMMLLPDQMNRLNRLIAGL